MRQASPIPFGQDVQANMVVDAIGRLCPIPVTWTARAVESLAPGQIVELHADDPMAVLDMRCWCASWGHDYLGDTSGEDGVLHIFVRKGHGERPVRRLAASDSRRRERSVESPPHEGTLRVSDSTVPDIKTGER